MQPWIPSSWAGSKQKLESVSQVSETGSCQIQKVSNSFPSYNSAALIPPWRIQRVFQRAAGRCRIPLCSGYKPGLPQARPSEGCCSLQNWSNRWFWDLWPCSSPRHGSWGRAQPQVALVRYLRLLALWITRAAHVRHGGVLQPGVTGTSAQAVPAWTLPCRGAHLPRLNLLFDNFFSFRTSHHPLLGTRIALFVQTAKWVVISWKKIICFELHSKGKLWRISTK